MKNPKEHLFRKVMSLIFIAFILFFFVAGFITTTESKFQASLTLLNKWMKDFTTEAFVYAMGTENHYFTQILPKSSKPPSGSSVLMQFATNLRPGDPRSLLSELPGYALYDAEIYIAGKGTNYSTLPIDTVPPIHEILKENDPSEEKLTVKEPNKDIPSPKITTNGKTVVYIYHSHSYESFKPLLKNRDYTSSNPKANIIAIGKELKKDLEKRGIGASNSSLNVGEALKARNWGTGKAYILSREAVQHTLANNRDINYLIDMHRDSLPRKYTTITINNQSYARLFFVVGREHPNFEKNLRLAESLNKRFEKEYPGLSRGVIIKNKHEGNGIYNQDLSQNALLIEMGGIDNNLEELYRTSDAFADVFSEFYWQAEKVNANK
ncbi:stage II sporulation protein P [Fictibacillus sp. NRS-1165]|uniref:stage II sporulation protein P n=1 Tax=Fictibacillus sp. NRS-1165 TaxID=3144463 RepID=UPI003D224DA1